MNITGIQSIIYGCEDLDAAGRFLSDLGFEPIADTSAGSSYGLADGTSLVLEEQNVGSGSDSSNVTYIDGSTVID